jgi:hypothetical protein
MIRWLGQTKPFVPPAEAGLPFMGRLDGVSRTGC